MITDQREQVPDEIAELARRDAQEWNPAREPTEAAAVAARPSVSPTEVTVGQLMTRDPRVLGANEVLDAQSLLRTFHDVRHLPIVEDGRLVGMLTRTDVLRFAFTHPGQKLTVRYLMSAPAESIHPDETLHAAAERMVHGRIRGLPVVDANEKVIGIVTDSDVMSAIAAQKIRTPLGLDTVPVEAVMNEHAHSVTANAPLRDVAAIMLSRAVRHLPVLGSEGQLVGIVSERDVRSRFGAAPETWFLSERPEFDDPVRLIMAPEPIALAAGTPLTEAMDVLIDEGVGALPVTDDADQVVGILSYVDVLRFIAERLHESVH